MPGRCTIYKHVRSGGPFCDCGALVTDRKSVNRLGDRTTEIGINADKLMALLKETSAEFRTWLAEQEHAA